MSAEVFCSIWATLSILVTLLALQGLALTSAARIPVYEGWGTLDPLSIQNFFAQDRWIVAFKEHSGASIEDIVSLACSSEEIQMACKCVDDRPRTLGFAVFECPNRLSVDELASYLEDNNLNIQFIEKEQRVEGAPVMHGFNLTDQANQQCSNESKFTFPQMNPPNWGLDRCDQKALPLDNVFNLQGGLNGCGVYLYVLDTGVNTEHEDFSGRILPGKDSTGSQNVPPYRDDTGHGTHCTGIAAGYNYGMAKDVYIVPVKVLDMQGVGTSTTVLSGISWAMSEILARSSPAVISLSLAAPQSRSVNQAMKMLYEAGIAVVAAAGNYNMDACAYSPASSPHVLTVGATRIEGEKDLRAVFSNYGSCVDVWAPGMSIQSTWVGSQTAVKFLSGTSMAAPHFSGLAALYLQKNPAALPEEVFRILTIGSTEIPSILGTLSSTTGRMCNVLAVQSCTPQRDCMVSDWTDWSTCPEAQETCGKHTSYRSRTVLSHAACGGRQCPDLLEYRSCDRSFPDCSQGGVPAEFLQPGDVSLSNSLLQFDPLADDTYTSCFTSGVSEYPEAADNGATVNLEDDESSQIFLGNSTFRYFGKVYGSIHIGSNGYITLGAGDFRYASTVGSRNPKSIGSQSYASFEATQLATAFAGFRDTIATRYTNNRELLSEDGDHTALENGATHWDLPRISIWFQDLHPESGSARVHSQVRNEAGYERVIVTYEDVPCQNEQGPTSTFQAVLWLEGSKNPGKIQLWWKNLGNCEGAVVGLAPGESRAEIPPNYVDATFASIQEKCEILTPPKENPKDPSLIDEGLSIFFT